MTDPSLNPQGPKGPRRHWSVAEKLAVVQETYEPSATVTMVALRHGVARRQLYRWRKLAAEGALRASNDPEEVVTASKLRILENQVHGLEHGLGQVAHEVAELKEALVGLQGFRGAPVAPAGVIKGWFVMRAVCTPTGKISPDEEQ